MTSGAKAGKIVKTYIPNPKGTSIRGKYHKSTKITKKEVITTSHKEKKAVAPASKTDVATKTDAKKSNGKRA